MSKTTGMVPLAKWIAFSCFILSGSASISYEMIWLRQAMTYFGVINPVVSTVLSVFMAGLALGTWISGKITDRVPPAAAVKYYAVIEILVGLYALVVPELFKASYVQLLSIGAAQSAAYLAWSVAIITAILLPVCTLIGCTFPMLMHYLRGLREDKNNFGFLYYANLVGAALGCVLPLVIIELYGFAMALYVTIAQNLGAFLLAIIAWLMLKAEVTKAPTAVTQEPRTPLPTFLAITLFLFGFVTMGSEVLWIRVFMPQVGPTVYSFAFILIVYLLFTAIGTRAYLGRYGQKFRPDNFILLLLPTCALLPVLSSDTRVLSYLFLDVGSIGAISFCLGYLTPKIIDEIAGNDARKASIAYLYNFAGCILGPLFSTYILFFAVGTKKSLIFYTVILFVLSQIFLRKEKVKQWAAAALFLALLYPTWTTENMEDYIAHHGKLERDYVGYIGGVGTGMSRLLLVNGIGMTQLATVTKSMAHLPMLHHPNPKSVLVICFGMGTTMRSFTSWPLDKITVVELSKGVTRLFDYFHADAARVMADPRVHVVVDDGRRFLNRTDEKFDIITIDPPPPVTSSGSGLLYTVEFLSVLKKRLAPGGIFTHWIFPWDATGKDMVFMNASINAIKHEFKYIKIYQSIVPMGWHVLASDSPIPSLDVQGFLRKLPPKAAEDLKEWETDSLEKLAARSLQVVDEDKLLLPQLQNIYMSDNRLYNEFYGLRAIHLFIPTLN